MPAQDGKDLLVKAETAIPATYAAVGAFRSNSFTINGEGVDITNKDSAGFKEMLDGAGVRSVSASGTGVLLTSDAQLLLLTADALGGLLRLYEIIIPGWGTYAGSFLLTSLEFAGEHNGEANYNISLESSGEITFTAI